MFDWNCLNKEDFTKARSYNIIHETQIHDTEMDAKLLWLH